MDEITKMLENSEEGEENAMSSVGQQAAIVFLVDVGDKMLDTGGKMEAEPILLALKCIRQWLRNYIVQSVNCYVSLLFLSTNKKEDGQKTIGDGVYTCMPMVVIGAEAIKKIDDLIKLIQEKKFRAEYEVGKFGLSDGLWKANLELMNVKRKVRKNIILMTNEEEPFKTHQDQVRSIAKLYDFEKSYIAFQIVPFGPVFDAAKYQEIVQIVGEDKLNLKAVLTEEEALERCELPKKRMVPLVNLPFIISSDLSIPVNIHNLCRPVKVPNETYLSAENNAPITTTKKAGLVSETTITSTPASSSAADGTDAVVGSGTSAAASVYQTIMYEKIGEQKVTFTEEEKKRFDLLGDRQLKLVGFKPMSWLSLELHVHPSCFVVPYEAGGKGASALFVGLIERCRAKEVVAICTFCPRVSSLIRFVALLPVQTADSTGFLVIYLPFVEEVRDLDTECTQPEPASEDLVQLQKEVIKKLSFPFDPTNFPNPELATYWAAVEAQALGYDQLQPVMDPSMPDFEAQRQRLGELQDRLREAFYSGGYECPMPGPKRKAPVIDSKQNIDDVEQHYADDSLGKLTLDKLKNYLKQIGRAEGISKMKKNEVIRRITDILNQERESMEMLM